MIDGEMYKYSIIITAKGELRVMVKVSGGCGHTLYNCPHRLTLCMAWHEHRLMLAG